VDSFVYPPAGEICVSEPLSTRLGLNLYAKDKNASPPAAAPLPPASSASNAAPPPKPVQDSAIAEREILQSGTAAQASKDLNLLAELVGGAAAQADGFKLNLFPDQADAQGSGAGGPPLIVIDIGSSALQESNRDLVGIMGDMKMAGSGDAPKGGNDLLDLMDSQQ